MTDLNIKIGGAAGQGLQRAGFLLSKALVRSGYWVFAVQDNMSRVRGGHNFMQVRVSDRPVGAMTRPLDLLVALDAESVPRHRSELKPDGLLIIDSETLKTDPDGPNMVDVPLRKLALAHGGKPVFGNSVAVGFALGVAGLGMAQLQALFVESFGPGDLADKNTAAARAGFELAQTKCEGCLARLEPLDAEPRMLVSGNEAIALGAMAAGVKFMSAYPMSPSTGIIECLARHQERVGLVTEQAEDEIAAAHLAFGASMAGVRAMTATSGGGMALMAETISLLGASEVPLVIVNCQRPGPATGMPTKTEQSDLLFSIYAGHGEFTRAVLAPGNAEQAFYGTMRAFNLADRFQIPVIVLSDQHLSDSYWTVPPFDPTRIPLESSLIDDGNLAAVTDYRRYRLTEDGVSARLYPGQSGHLVLTDSHEHDETGRPEEDPESRNRMVEKRLVKTGAVREALARPEQDGTGPAQITVVGWGTTREALFEAASRLREKGVQIAAVHLADVWPLPKLDGLADPDRGGQVVVVEGNATGQLAQLMAGCSAPSGLETVLKYDGRPFNVDDLVAELERRVGQ